MKLTAEMITAGVEAHRDIPPGVCAEQYVGQLYDAMMAKAVVTDQEMKGLVLDLISAGFMCHHNYEIGAHKLRGVLQRFGLIPINDPPMSVREYFDRAGK